MMIPTAFLQRDTRAVETRRKRDKSANATINHDLTGLRSALRLADIALAAGFYDQSHFTHAFRVVTGSTPARYRAGLRAGQDLPKNPRSSKTA